MVLFKVGEVPRPRLSFNFPGRTPHKILMILWQVPDIRLFWSQDPRFTSQFQSGDTHIDTPPPSLHAHAYEHMSGEIIEFQPYSKYPPTNRDVSMW